jgi:hypothetical protein
MNDEFVELSVTLKSGARLLCFGAIEEYGDSSYLRARGLVEYTISSNNSYDQNIAVRPFDAATDDTYTLISMDDVLMTNIMSEQFLEIFRRYHFDDNQFDLGFLESAHNLVKGNFPCVQ